MNANQVVIVKRIGDEADRQLAEPTPYAKAFRENVCPVPEFPGIRHQSMRGDNGRCAQCGLWSCHHLYTTSNTANGPQEAQADPQDHSCHDECACQNGGHPMPDFVVPQTEGEDK